MSEWNEASDQCSSADERSTISNAIANAYSWQIDPGTTDGSACADAAADAVLAIRRPDAPVKEMPSREQVLRAICETSDHGSCVCADDDQMQEKGGCRMRHESLGAVLKLLGGK